MTKIKNFYTHKPKQGNAEQIVFLLHGLGSNGRDLISLAPYWAEFLPQAVFVSPDAPFACDMVPPGYPDSYQWFSLQSRDPNDMLEGVRVAAPVLKDFMDEQLKVYGLEADRLALAGFSQGTMMSLYAGPRYSHAIAGILGYSGALLWEEAERMNRVPVHLIHGDADEVVPPAAWGYAKAMLEKNGFAVSGHMTPGLYHSIDEEGIRSGGAFLKKVLD